MKEKKTGRLERQEEEKELEMLLDEIPHATSPLHLNREQPLRHQTHQYYSTHSGYQPQQGTNDGCLSVHDTYGFGSNSRLPHRAHHPSLSPMLSEGTSSRTSGTASPIGDYGLCYSPEIGMPDALRAADEERLIRELGLLSRLGTMNVNSDSHGSRSHLGGRYATGRGLFDGPSVLLSDQRGAAFSTHERRSQQHQQRFHLNANLMQQLQLEMEPQSTYSKSLCPEPNETPFPYVNSYETLLHQQKYGYDSAVGLGPFHLPVSPPTAMVLPDLNYGFPMLGRCIRQFSDGHRSHPPALEADLIVSDAFDYDESLILQGNDMFYVADKGRKHHRERRRSSDMDTVRNPIGSYKSHFKPMKYDSLMDVKGYIYHIAKDQQGCRFLQRQFEEGKPEDILMIFNEIIDHVAELMVNPFANYLMQKLFDVCTEEQKTMIIIILTEDLFKLVNISLNQHGTRAVQKLIEKIRTRQQITMLVSALRPGFLVLVRDPNGNHVIQRCLQYLSNEDNKFIFDAAAKHCVKIATHQHGCCVLQRCINHSTGEHQAKLVMKISQNGLLLAQDSFGNYVVQYVMNMRDPSVDAILMSQFEGSYVELSRNKFGSNVVEKCLSLWEGCRATIVIELLAAPQFDQLLQHQYANYVIQRALAFSKGDLHYALVHAILPHASVLRTSPYCKRIFTKSFSKKCTF